jgi:hypothetical protein
MSEYSPGLCNPYWHYLWHMAPRDAASAHIKILFYRWYSFSCNSYCTYLQTLFHSTILFIIPTHTSSIHTPPIHPCRRHLGMYLSNIVFTSPTVPKHTIYSSLDISTAFHPYRLHLFYSFLLTLTEYTSLQNKILTVFVPDHAHFFPGRSLYLSLPIPTSFRDKVPIYPSPYLSSPYLILSLTYAVFIITANTYFLLRLSTYSPLLAHTAPIHPF